MSLSIANVFQKPKFQVSLRKASSKHLIIVAIVFIKLETHQVYYVILVTQLVDVFGIDDDFFPLHYFAKVMFYLGWFIDPSEGVAPSK